jgi:hypothetical protein
MQASGGSCPDPPPRARALLAGSASYVEDPFYGDVRVFFDEFLEKVDLSGYVDEAEGDLVIEGLIVDWHFNSTLYPPR